ncbi:putative uncharacterized protein [Firmicutes bacterium CAG:822]|nr:putative uncharacterized protein [Firmicutes bacterium CAG:822]
MPNYDDIINLPHHISKKRKPMSLKNRSAQFAPFSALKGYQEKINEIAKLNDSSNKKMNDIINIDDDKLNKNEKEYIDENTKTKI